MTDFSTSLARSRAVDGDLRRALVRRTRRLEQWLRLPIEVSLVDDDRMRTLCQTHLGEDKTTDVLSFSPEAPPPGFEDEDDDAGQIAINVDAVIRQAPRHDRWAWLDEASSLLVHGAAHLLGHDHDTRSRARAMLRLERRLARRLGLVWLPRPYGADA